jgi:hypothetical protein
MSPMNPYKAAEATLELIHPGVLSCENPRGDGSGHMAWMLEQIVKGDMSIGKANRWLGWAQCLAMIYGHITLDQSKNINRNAQD